MKGIYGLVGWLGITFIAAWVGSRFMPGEWYASLAKPTWNPPNAIFGPVWSVLYVLMGVSAWLVWRRSGFAGAGLALSLFVVQLVLNALWSYLFFGRFRPDLAFLDIVALWSIIAIVTVLFWQNHRAAGAMMIPYLLWVSFASCLNFVIWRFNVVGPR
ncbi:MAG: tryptophan-rich sensory protein [Elusimicrobia bacterium]|nr:tryptophan-rich sensory protein [Elusimicrobiota bacterium]